MDNFKTSDGHFSSDDNLAPLSVQRMDYTELMPVTEENFKSMYLPVENPMQASSPGMKTCVGSYARVKEHRILGKRKRDDFDDDSIADDKSVRTNDDKKQNHSEIEKRRRDKMNTYITELATMIPMCHANPRKLDKLTVLRMAVQHLRSVRGAVHSYTEGHYKPSFLSDEELKHLILKVADGFLFVVGCDRGRILFVSESVKNTLYYNQSDLLGQSWFDILHPKDLAKIKEQLSSSDLSPRERLIDSKTMLPVKTDMPLEVTRLGPGARRSFFCRMKCKSNAQVKEEAETNTSIHRTRKNKMAGMDRRYCVVHCTGYMKYWTPAKSDLEESETDSESEGYNLSCLVAIGRVLPQKSQQPPLITQSLGNPRLRQVQFVSRYTQDGTFLFVDIRATSQLGYLPQELVGTSMYEYFHHDDIKHLSETHLMSLTTLETQKTQYYRFRTKSGGYVKLLSEWRPFKNPWTKDTECLISKNTVIPSAVTEIQSEEQDRISNSSGSNLYEYDLKTEPAQENNSGSILGGLNRVVTSHVEASLIGQQIVKEAARKRGCHGSSSSNGSSPSPSASLSEDPTNSSLQANCSDVSQYKGDEDILNGFLQSPSLSSSVDDVNQNLSLNNLCLENFSNTPIRNNANLSSVAVNDGSPKMLDPVVMPNSPQMISASNDGNDEAAMAVIMSLLEADAGLGGPVDFSGLPWPLP